jgi:hypothetical protein
VLVHQANIHDSKGGAVLADIVLIPFSKKFR